MDLSWLGPVAAAISATVDTYLRYRHHGRHRHRRRRRRQGRRARRSDGLRRISTDQDGRRRLDVRLAPRLRPTPLYSKVIRHDPLCDRLVGMSLTITDHGRRLVGREERERAAHPGLDVSLYTGVQEPAERRRYGGPG